MYFRPASALRENPRLEQMIKRDATHGESCCQEDGEKVRRQETREEIRAQGRRKEGDAQRRGEESLREEDLRKKDGCEEVRRQEDRGEEVGRQERPSQTQENGAHDSPRVVGHSAGLLIGSRCEALADQAPSLVVRPRLISLLAFGLDGACSAPSGAPSDCRGRSSPPARRPRRRSR